MPKLTFFLIACVLALLAVPSAAFQDYWSKQHCNPTDADTMNLQIYLKWSNMNLLDNYVHHGASSDLPFDIEHVTKISEAQDMWRFVLRPQQASRDHVFDRMTRAGLLVDNCEEQWDSLHCKNVPVQAVARLFNVEMCQYKQRTSALVAAVPELAGRLDQGTTYWLADVRKAALRNEHIQYVGGVALYDPTVVPRRRAIAAPEQNKKRNKMQLRASAPQPYEWPQPLQGNAPSILMGLGLPQFGSLADFGAVQVALFCKDGSATNYSNSLLASSCPNGVPYPKYLQVRVPETVMTLSLDLLDSDCMTIYDGFYPNEMPWALQAICSVDAHALVNSMTTWGLYHIEATVVFSDMSHSQTVRMKNFFNAQYLSDMRVTYPTPMAPADIRTLYQINDTERLMSNESAQGILEFSDTMQPGRGFLVADLRLFLVQYNVVPESEVDAYLAKWFVEINTHEYESRGETSLDIEMMMSLARTGKTYLWNIINGPGVQYLHWSQAFIAWAQNVTSGIAPSSAVPPSVWSISYGGPEWSTPNDSAEDADTLNNYFKLMTASGVTVVVSSGDSGAGFFDGQDVIGPLVSYPASSPYVVAAGASANRYDPTSQTVIQAVCSAAEGNVITSGGGFSQSYGTPDYQAAQVSDYLVNATFAIPAGMRGLPDVAAIGAWVNIVMSNATIPVFGTSISAPVFSSLLSLANDRRRVNGSGPVRLANWMVYRAPEGVFVDVTHGSNCAAEQYAFSSNFGTYNNNSCYTAVRGWDPASGVGTPMYPAFATFAFNWSASGIPTGSGSGSSSHTGAIVGGVIGGVAGLAILGFIIYKVTSKPADGADYQQI